MGSPVRPLEYGATPADGGGGGAALVVLPACAGAVTLAFAGHNIEYEPFGVFQWGDAAVQVGGPVVVLGLWVAWLTLAVRRRHRRRGRPRPRVFAAVLGWAALNLWVAYEFLAGYFHEPWNW